MYTCLLYYIPIIVLNTHNEIYYQDFSELYTAVRIVTKLHFLLAISVGKFCTFLKL